MRKRITLVISHPRLQVFDVELMAKVVHVLPVTPESLILKPNFTTGEPGIAEALIRNEAIHSVLLSAPPSQGNVTVDLSKRELTPGETATLRLKVDPMILTADRQEITVSTSDVAEKFIRLPVYLQPAVEVKAIPNSLRLGVIGRAEIKQKSPFKIVLRGLKTEEMQIEQISAPPFLRVQDVPSKLEEVDRMFFYWKENWSGSALSGMVEIRVKHPQSGRRAVVRIPVSGILRDAE